LLRKAAALKRICGRCAPQNAIMPICEEIKKHLTAVGVDGEKIRYVSVSLELLDATKRILQKQRNRLNKTKD